MNYSSVDLHFSADCNLRCKYCYLEKSHDKLFSYNNKIKEAMKNGNFMKNIKKFFDEDENYKKIMNVGLWGAEPTLNFSEGFGFLEEFLLYFSNIKGIFFSTNAVLGITKINEFIVFLENFQKKFNREIRLTVQFSLDGPDYINDYNRGTGVTKNTVETMKAFVESYTKNEHKNYNYEILTKTTMTISQLKELMEKNLIFDFYSFFDKIQTELLSIQPNNNIEIKCFGGITLENPVKCTAEEGKIFANFIKEVKKIDDSSFNYHKHPLITYGTKSLMENAVERKYSNYGTFNCSAGRDSISIDWEGNLYPCHRMLGDFVIENKEHDFLEKFRLKAGFSKKDFLQFDFLHTSYHDFLKMRESSFESLLFVLANTGQIDKKAIQNEAYRKILFYLCIDVYCYIGVLQDITHEIFAFDPNYIKLFGNGAVDEYLDYHLKFLLGDKINGDIN